MVPGAGSAATPGSLHSVRDGSDMFELQPKVEYDVIIPAEVICRQLSIVLPRYKKSYDCLG